MITRNPRHPWTLMWVLMMLGAIFALIQSLQFCFGGRSALNFSLHFVIRAQIFGAKKIYWGIQLPKLVHRVASDFFAVGELRRRGLPKKLYLVRGKFVRNVAKRG